MTYHNYTEHIKACKIEKKKLKKTTAQVVLFGGYSKLFSQIAANVYKNTFCC